MIIEDNSEILELESATKHQRRIDVQSCVTDRGTLQVRSVLYDTLVRPGSDDDQAYRVHYKVLRLEIDSETGLIIGADFAMPHGGPNPACVKLPVAADKLIGLHSGATLARHAQKLFRKENGCTHIISLINATIPAIMQAFTFNFSIPQFAEGLKDDPGDVKRKHFLSRTQGNCHVLAATTDEETVEHVLYYDLPGEREAKGLAPREEPVAKM